MVRRASLHVLAAPAFAAAVLAATAVLAQDTTLTLQQLERKYPRMNAVHIAKCDHDGDGVYNHSEQLCVASIYNTMYRRD